MRRRIERLVPAHVNWGTAAALLIVTVASFFTYVYRFDDPAVPIWDERYYIVAAEKYLHGIYFQDLHPPLGKLLVAAGERLVGRNRSTIDFLNVTYWAEAIPPGFSFFGFRLIPVVLAWLTAPVLCALFIAVTRSRALGLMLSAMYVFDNALVAHLRTAMLEGPLLFFTGIVLLVFVRLETDVDASVRRTRVRAAVLGAALGCAVMTKAVGVSLLVLPLALIWRRRADRRAALECALLVAAPAVILSCGIWMTHFALARHVNTVLLDGGYYQVPSVGTRAFVEGTRRVPIATLPAQVVDWIRFVNWYDRARPAIDFCRVDEHASPPWMWPIGARAVPYWWDGGAGGAFRYVYLQVNPIVWWTALAGLLLSAAVLAASAAGFVIRPLRHRFLVTSLLATYAAYFALISSVRGVLYLYHYFIPLILSFVLAAVAIDAIEQVGRWRATNADKRVALVAWTVAVVAAFVVYKPLTYFERPLSNDDLSRRAVVALWDLRCPGCPHTDGLCPNVVR
jgi:dolichyl-phosphate-mannose-protein mannosyltransferase